MRTIDISKIIALRKLNKNEVAQHLFPTNKYSRLALNRVISGEAVLDADQISKLASLADLTISELYSGENWKTTSKKGIYTFTCGEFEAQLDSKTNITRVMHNNSLFHESVIMSGATPISVYLKEIETIIDKYANSSN